jgi:hypothetical protein
VLLTVSPVALAATFEDRHVMVSTTYSKSVLRVAAQEARERFDFVDYFPSYEIITGSPTGGLYYEDDDRQVNRQGVAHAMRVFMESYTTDGEKRRPIRYSRAILQEQKSMSQVVCEEDLIEGSIRQRNASPID